MAADDVTLPLNWDLDPARGLLTDQLAGLIRDAIKSDQLRSGDRIPPTRVLANDLGISRGTATNAIELLVAEGLLESRMGSGVFVSADAESVKRTCTSLSDTFAVMPGQIIVADEDRAPDALINFHPCPSFSEFPIKEWRRCLANASGHPLVRDYSDPQGTVELRTEIASYLRRGRGLHANADEILVTSGTVNAVYLLSAIYADQRSHVAYEDPGYPLFRQTFETHGAQIIPIPVDRDGLVVDALPKDARHIRFVYVTPSHQLPMGSRLSLGRRHALIEWAQRNDVIIIEDDYDGEYRFDVAPLAPLASMTNDNVIYCGTFSKSLFPGIRTGFVVAPKPLIEALSAFRTLHDYATNTIIQIALSRFIEQGHFERHIHRMRRVYAKKRQTLSDALARYLPMSHLSGLQSGLHAVAEFHDGIDARALSEMAWARKIAINSLDRYAMDQTNCRNGLVFGYAALRDEQITQGVRALSELAKEL